MIDIPVGETRATLTIKPIDDAVAEPTENVHVHLISVGGGGGPWYIGSPDAADEFIFDNDTPTTVWISNIDDEAREQGQDKASFKVNRSGDPSAMARSLDVPLDVLNTTTAAPGDYSGLPTVVHFNAYQTSVTVNVTPTDDVAPEWTERLDVEIQDQPTRYARGEPKRANLEVVDDDAVGLVIAAPSTPEAGALIMLNDDDDDDNEHPDLEDNTASSDDDLVQVTLTYPADVKAGAVLTLTADTDHLNVWTDVNKSELLVGSGQESHQWAVGQDVLPTAVYVEGIRGSDDVGDASLYFSGSDAGSPSTTHATTTQVNKPATVPWVQLLHNGVQAGVRPVDVMVGAHNTFFVAAGPAALVQGSTNRWEVTGDILKGYIWSIAQGKAVRFADSDFTATGLEPYWIDGTFGGKRETVTVTVTVNGVPLPPRKAVVAVHRPVVDFFNQQPSGTQGIRIGPDVWGHNPPWNTSLDYGVPDKAGNVWTAQVTAPVGGAGEIGVLQRFVDDDHRVTATGAAEKRIINGQYVLDNSGQAILYGDHRTPIAGGAAATVDGDDSPGFDLDGVSDINIHDIFQDYLMYQPAGGIWVPLSVQQWSWTVHASKDVNGTWSFGLKGEGSGASGNTTIPPEWSGYASSHLGNSSWVPE